MAKNIPKITQLSWVARCKYFDQQVKEFLQKHPDGTIVNIGCGLIQLLIESIIAEFNGLIWTCQMLLIFERNIFLNLTEEKPLLSQFWIKAGILISERWTM